jgi:hypothetical protein
LEIEAFAFDAEDEAVVVQARRLLGLPPWIREVPATGGGDAAAVVRVESDGADSAPAVMDPGIHPLVPVLRSNYWLTIHVLTITLGYAAFALTLGLANVSLFYFLRAHKKGHESEAKKQIASMNQLTYRAMQFGVVLLAAGTILGGVWADYSWGRFWCGGNSHGLSGYLFGPQ